MAGAWRAKLALIVLAAIGVAGCQRLPLKKKAPLRPFVPPPVTVRTVPPQPLIITDPPPNPGLFLDVSSIPYPIFGATLELPERPKPPTPRFRPTTQPPPATEPAEPTSPPVSVPKLTQILSDEEARKYRAEMEEARGSAERVLEAAVRRPLNATQTELAQQVRVFLRQASEQRETDLVAARNLARRAAILARDLQSTLR